MEEKLLAEVSTTMQDIVNAIPGGVAIYRVTDKFETVYFSSGVPELTGYTVEEYREMTKRDAAEMTYWEDTQMVVGRAYEVIRTHQVASFEFRKQHRDGHIVWVRVQIKWIGEENGAPLLHCVFHNISDLKEAQLEMDHLVNSIPGGIASYRVEGGRFIPTFFSDGVMQLTGHTREEYEHMVRRDALDLIYEPDKERVATAVEAAVASGEVLDVSYRMRHKDGRLIWIHLNGRRMGPLAQVSRFYAVFTGMSEETRLFQSLVNESVDGIYVINKDNYELLYTNESKTLFQGGRFRLGQKCYAALHGKTEPCEFCTLRSHAPDGKEHEMPVDGDERFFNTRFQETNWNGIPAYVKFVRDVTDEVMTRREKERLEQYFQTVVKNLPGGVAVVHYEKDGRLWPEFLSDGFAAMTGMPLEQAWELYRGDAMAGVHPDDRRSVNRQMEAYIASGEDHCEIVYRLKRGDGSYAWVKNALSLIQNEGGESRVYAVYQDVTKEREEQERIRRQYRELIMQHYRTQDPNVLVMGHCNITENRIMEIIDHTDSDLLKTFGWVRESFFTGLSSLVVDERDRQKFLDIYLNGPSLRAFECGETERRLECFVRLPKEELGRYVQFNMNLVATPDTNDVTGILTVTDITDRMISDRILHQLSASGYDFVADLDLLRDTYKVLLRGDGIQCAPTAQGCHSKWMEKMLRKTVVPRDRERYREELSTEYMLAHLKDRSSYTFAFSLVDDTGDVRTKNMTVTAVDLRLGRVCLSRSDITDSVREQQRLLRVIAYTFELAGFVDIGRQTMTLYTRETVLENLPPHFVERYDEAMKRFVTNHGAKEGLEDAILQFQSGTMVKRLEKKPEGYDFLFAYKEGDRECYKQINVLWGDSNHKTICLVRADVTDMLAAERQAKKTLEDALALAKEANRAKSDFLSAMSHDIRTPMNAIMGMTTLAAANMGDLGRVKDCLQKISVSSRHLLSLINDILDMSKIERGQITLNRMKIDLTELLEQISAIIAPQARAAGLQFTIRSERVRQKHFYGDGLRISQILINLLSNAVKYTPEGGSVTFTVEETGEAAGKDRVGYRFVVQDTGVGMSKEFLSRLFEPFTRSRSDTCVEGTGLGLSITKGLVELMEGRISVESEPGRGSTFQVEFTCDIAREEEHMRAQSGMEQKKADRNVFVDRLFLVAEDNAINAEILSELLAMYGARTVVRTDGCQAVREFEQTAPGTYAAILMDVQMPKMNGYEATRAIRGLKRPAAADIPIIAMTANAFAEDIREAREAGMDAHVAKPIDLNLLREALEQLFEE